MKVTDNKRRMALYYDGANSFLNYQLLEFMWKSNQARWNLAILEVALPARRFSAKSSGKFLMHF